MNKEIEINNKEAITYMDVTEALFEIYINHNNIFDNYMEFTEYGRKRGWLEEQDLTYANLKIDRRSLARIIHEFIRIELGVEDINDWSNAKKLKDLYDCRVCAKHVAQMVERNIIPPRKPDRFGLLDRVSGEEFQHLLLHISKPFIG